MLILKEYDCLENPFPGQREDESAGLWETLLERWSEWLRRRK